jgi:hypothetical protein
MARYPDPHARLACALTGLSGGEIVESRHTPWASATFAGARHRYLLRVPPCGSSTLNGLDEREFDLPGHILADIALSDQSERPDACFLTIEALTVEDARP